ncbi:uncharacterized protein PRCAT00004635001 [Priceomyces carsonii]|uniref:uncharacterized protein n=1 Tax=Priceomyces carsonii TaxID=28549 RepID=UPI002ED8D7C8|nr:unnamed protein product [Priceomyces carsonii]
MATLTPAASSCYRLQLPPTEADDRLNLHVRTGSASTLFNSLVFAYGGLTIGLELNDVTIQDISRAFRQHLTNNQPKDIRAYLSGEFFYLNLIEKVWKRVKVKAGDPKPKPRLFHEIAAMNNRVYVFGGLTVPEDWNYEQREGDTLSSSPPLVPCNDLWEFDLETSKWACLDDGSTFVSDNTVPGPRYSHKMTAIGSLSFANKSDHFGIFIAGGKDANSKPIFENVIFDLVEKKYVSSKHTHLRIPHDKLNEKYGYGNVGGINDDNDLNVDYTNSIIVNFTDRFDDSIAKNSSNQGQSFGERRSNSRDDTLKKESIIVYAPVRTKHGQPPINPLISFRLGKSIKSGKSLPLYSEERTAKDQSIIDSQTIPYNLRYPTGGLFGQNIVITGFLPNEYHISIFVYNKPTGKWSRLNVFCNHDYGSHRFWGGFAWQSHHKVVLIGNFITSMTTSSIRYFTVMITVSLPITNILISSELKLQSDKVDKKLTNNCNGEDTSSLGEDEQDDRRLSAISLDTPAAISFSEYVHYAAPKSNFTTVRSVFPPAAVTLGRKALDRFGDLISDFELISSIGDRIPVSLIVLMERWGRYFIELLARGYVRSVHLFEEKLKEEPEHSNEKHIVPIERPDDSGIVLENKGGPQFRLPFQELRSKTEMQQINDVMAEASAGRPTLESVSSSVDPHEVSPPINSSKVGDDNSIVSVHLDEIPPQLPLPEEPLPAVPSTPSLFKSTSRKGSNDVNSPRASLIHTLTVLRNIPLSKSPRSSPMSSPRPSLSGPSSSHESLQPSHDANVGTPGKNNRSTDELLGISEKLNASKKSPSFASLLSLGSHYGDKKDSTPSIFSDDSLVLGNKEEKGLSLSSLLDFENLEERRKMEPSLVPRKLYMPFSTTTLKAFCEYLYTGQVGNKWLLTPTALDNLQIAKFYDVPLLYDLISEVLFGIIGRKEHYISLEGKKLKNKYFKLLKLTNTKIDPNFKFPLDEYQGFLNTVDDGYLDVALMKKTSSLKHMSTVGRRRKSSSSSKVGNDDGHLSSNVEGSADNSTEDSSGKRSSDEENDFELRYLDNREEPHVGPKSKSVFDRANNLRADFFQSTLDERAGNLEIEKMELVTLEQIASPNSPVPRDYAIELIYEAASIVADIKLMLRALNVRHMSRILKQSQTDLGLEIDRLTHLYDENIAEEETSEEEGGNNAESEVECATPPKLNPTRSTSSLGSILSNVVHGGSDKAKMHSSLRNVGGFTPVKQTKTQDAKLRNKELDKQITKLIKKDENLKSKQEKSDKRMIRELQKSEKLDKKTDKKADKKPSEKGNLVRKSLSRTLSNLNPSTEESSPAPSNQANTKKHHGFFLRNHLKKK